MGLNYIEAVGAAPDCRTLAFNPWVTRLVSHRLRETGAARSTTYYFSTSGHDVTGDGSQANPWATIAKAHAEIQAIGGDVACLFRRGDVWDESPTLVFGQSASNSAGMACVVLDLENVTIGAYGQGNRPRFDHPHENYTTGWVAESGDAWTRTGTGDISWICREDRDAPLAEQTSIANCVSTPNSFFVGAGQVTVNLGGEDPNVVPLDGLIANNHTCFRATGNGCRVQDVEGWGWGQNPRDTNSHHYFISFAPPGTSAALALRCRASYGSAHVLASWNQGGGGIVTFVGCEANWSSRHSSTQHFNLFSSGGANENILENCIVRYGSLPQGTGAYQASTAAAAFNSHTTDPARSTLSIARGVCVKASSHPTGWDGAFTDVVDADGDISKCRAFVIGSKIEGADGSGHGLQFAPSDKNVARLNCDIRVRPQNLSIGALTNANINGWAFNNLLDLDLSLVGATPFGMFNSGNGASVAKLWLNTIVIRNRGTGSTSFNHAFVVNRDTFSGSTQEGTLIDFRGNIYSADSNDEARVRLGLGVSSTFDRNAYLRITAGSGGRLDPADDADGVAFPGLDRLGQVPVAGDIVYRAGPSDLGIEFDRSFAPRDPQAPSIGDLEARVDAVDAPTAGISDQDIDAIAAAVHAHPVSVDRDQAIASRASQQSLDDLPSAKQIAIETDARLLDAGDATDLIASIVARIDAADLEQIDQLALAAALRADIERPGGALDGLAAAVASGGSGPAGPASVLSETHLTQLTDNGDGTKWIRFWPADADPSSDPFVHAIRFNAAGEHVEVITP